MQFVAVLAHIGQFVIELRFDVRGLGQMLLEFIEAVLRFRGCGPFGRELGGKFVPLHGENVQLLLEAFREFGIPGAIFFRRSAQLGFDLVQFGRGLIALLLDLIEPLLEIRCCRVLCLQALAQFLALFSDPLQLLFQPRFALDQGGPFQSQFGREFVALFAQLS